MQGIRVPELSDEDIELLKKINIEDLKRMIEFLKGYNSVMWRNNDTGELVDEETLAATKVHIQPLPEYPEELIEMGRYFADISEKGFGLVKEEGFFDRKSFAADMAGTLFSPTLICALIADAYSRDRFCDGLLGFGVRDNIYLKMLLHLEDCKRYIVYKDVN